MRYFDDENAFTSWALKQARLRGWRAAHLPTMRPVRRGVSFVAVPVKEGKGFPDLVLVHPVFGVVWIELKMPAGRLKPDQVDWLVALRDAGQRVFVFKPQHQDDLLAVLDGSTTQTLFDERSVARDPAREAALLKARIGRICNDPGCVHCGQYRALLAEAEAVAS
jgi:hypothetical protein